MAKIPTGYESIMRAGTRKEAQKIVKALKKENKRRKYKIKKIGYRNFAILKYKY